MGHINPDQLGAIIKSARKAKGLTRERLSEIINISPRYLMSIENKNKKPSYDLLYNLVRELNIPADTIFYPEIASADPDTERLIRKLYKCNQHEIKVVSATADALLDK